MLDGRVGDDVFIANLTGDTMIGSWGVDTVNYENQIVSLTINLVTGTVTTGGLPIDFIFSIENVIGGSASDTITGDGNENTLEGRNGNDILSGGGGNDILIAGGGNDTLNGNLGDDTLQFGLEAGAFSGSVIANGDSGNDIITFGNDAGSFSGSAVANGGDDNDQLIFGNVAAWNGSVIANGDAGDDVITFGNNAGGGSIGSVVVDGGIGDDIVMFGTAAGFSSGSVVVDGGNVGVENDTFSYENVSVAVVVDLGAPTTFQNPDGNSNIKILNFENLIGGSGDDTLIGSSNNNIIEGGLGDDELTGNFGHDVFVYSLTLTGALVGGGDVEIIKDFSAVATNTDILRFENLIDLDEDFVIDGADLDTVTTVSDNTVDTNIAFDNGGSITLEGTLPSDLGVSAATFFSDLDSLGQFEIA